MKPFKSIDEQVNILTSRGLIVDDEQRAKDYLLTQNYYNIINGYGCFFPRTNNTFSNNTHLSEITDLYTIEFDLK